MGLIADAKQVGRVLEELGVDTNALGDTAAEGHANAVDDAVEAVRSGKIPTSILSVIERVSASAERLWKTISDASGNVRLIHKDSVDVLSKSGDLDNAFLTEALRAAQTAEERLLIVEAAERLAKARSEKVESVSAGSNASQQRLIATASATLVAGMIALAYLYKKFRD